MADKLTHYEVYKPYPRAGYIARLVRRAGLAVLKGFYTLPQLELIDAQAKEAAKRAPLVINRPELKTYRTYPELFTQGFHDLFYSRVLFDHVARAYFREPYAFPAKCYVTETHKGTDKNKLPYRLHFDDVHWLKFFLYLTDVRKFGGALEIVPGTHNENRHYREAQIAGGVTYDTMDTDRGGESIPVLTDLGDLIIFDTDLTHCAGASGERWAIQVLATEEKVVRWRNYEASHDRLDRTRKSKVSGNVGAPGI